MTATEAGIVDAPTNVKEMVKVACAVFEGRATARDKSCSVRKADASDYLQTRSLQATGDIIAVSDGVLDAEKPSELVPDVADRDVRPVPSALHRIGSRSHASAVLS